MKKKLNSKNALKLVAATSMTIFSLLSVFSATAAWFDSQRNLNNGANEMAVAHVESSVLSVSLHDFLGVSADETTFAFDPVADAAHMLLFGEDEIQLLFTDNVNWGSAYFYAWKNGGTEKNADWPGEAMTYFGKNDYNQDMYTISLDAAVYDRMIFNNGSGEQTIDITITDSIIENKGIYLGSKNGENKYTIETWPVGENDLAFNMGTYSPEDANHPVLLLFEVKGGQETIAALSNSDYFLAPPQYTATYATKAALNSALSGIDNGTLVCVTADEANGNKTTVYKCINTGVGDPSVQLKWVDPQLAQSGNPLSSAVQTHYFTFSYNPKTTNLASSDASISKSYIPFPKSSFTNDNRSSFVTVSGNDASFNKQVTLYEGDTTGYSYIGIVIDYNAEALEYLYSYYLGSSLLDNGLGFLCDWSLRV